MLQNTATTDMSMGDIAYTDEPTNEMIAQAFMDGVADGTLMLSDSDSDEPIADGSEQFLWTVCSG